MLPAAKHFDIIMGVDVHIVMVPTPAGPVPTPLPNPFIGMVYDLMDYIPIMGATVMVNGMMRAQAGTEVKNVPCHLPIPGPFQKPPANEGEMFMGSMTVLADGEPFSFMACPVLTCQDIGMMPPPRKKKKGGTKSMVLPTSTVLTIPAGLPVLVGGPPMISLTAMAMKIGLAALGKLAKKFKKKPKKPKKPKAPKSASTGKCTSPGHPVDVANGRLFTEITDFSIPGIIPLVWERAWFSDHPYAGPLGYGWSHNYDMALWEMLENSEPSVIIRLQDGREAIFPALEPGQSEIMREESLTLLRDARGYALRDRDLLYYRFEKKHPTQGKLLLSSIETLQGHRISFNYNDRGILHQITDTGQRIFTLKSNERGLITQIDGPHPELEGQMQPIIFYGYDEKDNLAYSQDLDGHAMQYRYQGHLLAQETYRTGLNFYFQFDGTDHTAKCTRTWGDGGIFDTKFQFFDGYTLVEDGEGHKTTYFHKRGLVYKTIDPLGHTSFKQYNENLELVGESDPLGLGPTFDYDGAGNNILSIDANGGATHFEYNDLNQLTKAVDPVGGVWTMEYDDQANLISKKDPLGNTVSYSLENGLVKKIANPTGGITEIGYDTAGNITEIVAPNQQISRWKYDRLGQLVESIDARGNIQKWTYNALGLVTEIAEPDGNIRSFQYDGERNLIRARDMHRDVQFQYSGFNHLAARQEAGVKVEFFYDKEGRLTGISNENRSLYRFKLNGNGDVVEEQGFDGLLRVYERDAAGQVSKVHRPGNRQTIYTYDGTGQVIRADHSDGSWEQFTYRADGELIGAANSHIQVQLERDMLGRVIQDSQGGYSVQSAYDAMGFRTGVQSSLGADLQFHRNTIGDVESIHSGLWQTRFVRDAQGLELQREYSGGLKSRWSRDKLGRPVRQETFAGNGVQIRSRSYRWETNDRIKEILDAQQGLTKYGHDALGNLTWAQNPNGSVDYRLPDAIGNLFRTQDKADRQYGPAGQLLSAGGARYAYDVEGNLVKKVEADGKTWLYEWNMAGMLHRVVRPDQQAVVFQYDALGRRIVKTFHGKTTRWVWDGNTPLHEWIEPSEDFLQPVRAEIPGSHQEKSKNPYLSSDTLTTWIFEPDTFSPVAKLVGQTRYGIITDHLGTPLSMHAEDGRAVWAADLNVYGQAKNQLGKPSDCPFRFPGQYEDVETGLYYNRFRYYDAEIGGYVSQDPIGLLGGMQVYGYVFNPTNQTDIFGLTCGGGNAAVGGVGGTVDYVAGVQAKSFGKIVGEGTVHVRPTINAIENGSHLPRNATGYLNKELHTQLLGKPAGYWQEYDLIGFGGKSPLRILQGRQGEYFLSPDHYKSIIPLNY